MRDAIDEILDIQPGSRLDQLRALRPELREAAARYEAALFAEGAGLTLGERHAVAAAVAEWLDAPDLARRHAPHAAESARLPRLLAHAEMLTRRPHAASRAAIEALLAAGLAPRDVVLLSQLVAHLNHTARMLVALRLLERAP